MTVASFFQNIETEAKTWAKTEYDNVLKPLIAKEEAAFKPLIPVIEQDFITYGIPIILSLAGDTGAALSGEEKMGTALASFMSAVGAAGKTVAVNVAQAGLQILVNQVKGAGTAIAQKIAAGG